MNILNNNKHIIEKHFTKAIDHYDNNAKAQNIIAHHLFNIICQAKADSSISEILELGCGTGNLSTLLHNRFKAQMLLNDICSNCYTYVSTKITDCNSLEFVCADAEQLVVDLSKENRKFDIITSSSAIQWLSNPLGFIKACKAILKPRGIIAFSSFLPNNLEEIKTIVGERSMLKYPDFDEIKETLLSNYTILNLESNNITLYFESPRHVLEHLKYTGVNATSTGGWSKGKLESFYQQYNTRFKKSNGLVSLSYKPVYFCVTNN